MHNGYGDSIISKRNNNFQNRHDIEGDHAGTMLRTLVNKLSKSAPKPIVIEHRRALAEKFALIIDEKPRRVIANTNSNTKTNIQIDNTPSDGATAAEISTIATLAEPATDDTNSDDFMHQNVNQSKESTASSNNSYRNNKNDHNDDDEVGDGEGNERNKKTGSG